MLLNCHSWFSLRYGTISPEELLKELSARGYKTFALTDINNTSAAIDFVRLSGNYGIRPVVGIDFRNGIEQKFTGIAKNNKGFFELNRMLTLKFHEEPASELHLPESENVFFILPLKTSFRELKENEYIGVRPDEISGLMLSPWIKKRHKLVSFSSFTFRNKTDFNIHRLLRAIENNSLLSRLPAGEQASEEDMIISPSELMRFYSAYPDIIQKAEKLIDTCSIEFEYGTNKNRKYFSGSHESDVAFLREECIRGLKYRFVNPGNEVIGRMEKELQMIDELGFCSYFLINSDLVSYARKRGFYYVGRGSGANSMVAYLLRITNVDPIELDLYFERFINPYRSSPPDFDIDFSWTDRDEITEYIFNKYGWEHTALLGTYITFDHKSAIRELSKVFGLPDDEIARLQKNPVPVDDGYSKYVITFSRLISGMPNQLSIHASGIVISEEPINTYTATHILPKGYPTTHFDMHVSEDIGLYKFDILSQRGLGKIKDTLGIIKDNYHKELDLNCLNNFKEDEKVKELLRTGKAIACFYVESPAMRMLLTKLKADDYKSLVAASSIIRPGVAQSGMMREYIVRFQDKAKREQARKAIPELYEILEDTYGVMVYQEDVIKVAHYFAGLSLSEADVLRRGMSWKFRERNEFWKIKEKFFENCRVKGYAEKTISDIWFQIESFANYAFSKGHSASYAVESFQALYLKAYYPIEYMTATLNNGGGFYSPELYFHEARLHGATLEMPCINTSEWLNTVNGKTIWMGFYLLNQLESGVAQRFISERQTNGDFTGLNDFVARVPVSLEQLIILIRANSFRFTGKTRKMLLWDAHYLMGHSKKTTPESTLFNAAPKSFQLPELWKHELEDIFDQVDLLGFTIESPFSILKAGVPTTLTASQLKDYCGKTVEITGYLVHRKPSRTKNGGIMYFGTWLDTEGQWIDTVHFPEKTNKNPFTGPGCYLIKGKVTEEYGFYSIETTRLERLQYRNLDN